MYIMAANEKQFETDKPHQRPDVLRAKDIIPGAGRPVSKVESEGAVRQSSPQAVDIPQFDLAQDIMAEHRRLTGSRRRSPSSITEQVSRIESRLVGREPRVEHRASSIEFAWQWDPLIADIVTRDIVRFCGGG